MTENENKKPAAEEQVAKVQSAQVAETVDYIADTGTAVARPGDQQPHDSEGCEAVTVVIVCQDPYQGSLAAMSVQKNLIGADADIQVVTEQNLRDTLAETLKEHLCHIHTERIVLMTDGMIILNPVMLGDIACVKAVKAGKDTNGKDVITHDTRLPVMMHKSALSELLEMLIQYNPHASVVNEYFTAATPQDYRPLILGSWRDEPWLLPVVSQNPPVNEIRKWAKTQKFAHISRQSWSPEVYTFLEDIFKE